MLHIIYCMANAQQAKFQGLRPAQPICTNGGHYKMAAGSGATMAGIFR